LEFFDFVILVSALSNGRECKCKTAKVHGNRHIKKAKVKENESSIDFRSWEWKGRVRKGQETNWPGSEKARERKGQGGKVQGSELARVLFADSLRGANWPGRVKARYRS